MNNSMQEEWSPPLTTLKWVLLAIVMAVLAGAYNLIMESEVRNSMAVLDDIAVNTDKAIDFEPSEERTAYLNYVKEITAQDIISNRATKRSKSLFKEAEKAELNAEHQEKKEALAKVIDKAL